MGQDTQIEWTDYTFNPWIGCTKVSPGCARCYAEEQDNFRFSKTLGGATKEQPISHWGKGAPRYRTSASNWKEPVKWDRLAAGGHHEERPRVFCASLADWLDEEVPIEWLADLLKLIHDTPNLDWLLLTKRPGNWRERIEDVLKWIEAQPGWGLDKVEPPRLALRNWLADWLVLHKALANVWMGATVENQAMADERIPELLRIPAKVRFLSCEPLLEGIHVWRLWEKHGKPDWVIIGGESGPKARGCNVEWIRSLVKECQAAGVAAFVKQLGSLHDGPPCKDAKGGDMAEWPEELRVREWPPVAPAGE